MSDTVNQTSLKQMFQGMVPEDCSIVEGIVINSAPLTIQVINNAKMVLSGAVLMCPRHLTNYATTATITLGKGEVDSKTYMSGEHSGHISGKGEHDHKLETFILAEATITIFNSLTAGEKVWLLSFKNGKQYYVLDRVVNG